MSVTPVFRIDSRHRISGGPNGSDFSGGSVYRAVHDVGGAPEKVSPQVIAEVHRTLLDGDPHQISTSRLMRPRSTPREPIVIKGSGSEIA